LVLLSSILLAVLALRIFVVLLSYYINDPWNVE